MGLGETFSDKENYYSTHVFSKNKEQDGIQANQQTPRVAEFLLTVSCLANHTGQAAMH